MHTLLRNSAGHTLFLFFASFKRSKSALCHLLCEVTCSLRTDKQLGNVTSVVEYSKIVIAQQFGDRTMHIIHIFLRFMHISRLKYNSGKLFRAAKKLLAKKEVPSFPEYVDNSALVNDIGRYFIRKINTIRSSIDAASDPSVGALLPDDPVVGPNKQLWEFQSLDEGQVSELIQKCSKKSCPSDPAPTSLVVSCLDELLPVITCLINGSMKIGIFPVIGKKDLLLLCLSYRVYSLTSRIYAPSATYSTFLN